MVNCVALPYKIDLVRLANEIILIEPSKSTLEAVEIRYEPFKQNAIVNSNHFQSTPHH
jgi:ribulose 1,5-bisphosphate synthetase/thiazole synthase